MGKTLTGTFTSPMLTAPLQMGLGLFLSPAFVSPDFTSPVFLSTGFVSCITVFSLFFSFFILFSLLREASGDVRGFPPMGPHPVRGHSGYGGPRGLSLFPSPSR